MTTTNNEEPLSPAALWNEWYERLVKECNPNKDGKLPGGSLAMVAEWIAKALDTKDARIAEAEALLRECAERLERNVNENETLEAKRAEAIQTGLALTVERDALRAKVAELEQLAADVDRVSKAEFQRLDAKVAELQRALADAKPLLKMGDAWKLEQDWRRGVDRSEVPYRKLLEAQEVAKRAYIEARFQ